MKKSGWIPAAVVLLIGIVVGYFGATLIGPSRNGNNIKSVADNYITALTKGDVDASYKLTSTVFQGRNTKDFVKQISETVRTDNPKFSDVKVFFGSDDQKDQAIYLATVDNLPKSALGRTSGNFVVRLVKEGGSWKIDSSQ